MTDVPESTGNPAPEASGDGSAGESAGKKPGKKIGPFEIQGTIGKGGMGLVYKALYRKGDASRIVALKVLSPAVSNEQSIVARFDREISILKKLRHENIVKYYGSGRHNKQQYYAMEYVEGQSLEELLKQKKRIGWEDALDYAIQTCHALEYAHERGIIHRDLKPGNLFLRRDGVLKLGDFGIARDTQDVGLTQAGRTVGTYSYMAPEQIVGKPPVSQRTDLYALGCVLYELISGFPPFESDNQADLFMKHLHDTPEPLTGRAFQMPAAFNQLIFRLLEKDTEARPFDALATRVELEKVRELSILETQSLESETGRKDLSRSVASTLAGTKKPTRRKRKKKKKSDEPFYERAWFLGLALLLLIGGVAWTLKPVPESEFFADLNTQWQEADYETKRELKFSHLEKYLEDYPEGENRERVQRYLRDINVAILETSLERDFDLGKAPKDDATKRYLEAYAFEQIGDYTEARSRYRALAKVYETTPDKEVLVDLALRRRLALKDKGGNSVEAVKQALVRADEAALADDRSEAEDIWRSILKLYDNKADFAADVAQARSRLNGESQPTPGSPAEDAS